MVAQPKFLIEQTIAIIGASSGIGLATAEAAADKGVRLVLAGRSDNALESLADRIRGDGGEAIAVHCDVSGQVQVEQLARVAVDRFGRIDTWIYNAGLGMHCLLTEIDMEDARRLFDINFWGVVHSSLAALPHLKQNGGALINVGSEVSEASASLVGIYTASKHAVKGFTDTLRIEVEQAPVSITLVQPTAVNTPFPEHSRNYMDQEPKLPPPTIEPELVAKAILRAAIRPTRAKKVGLKATSTPRLPRCSRPLPTGWPREKSTGSSIRSRPAMRRESFASRARMRALPVGPMVPAANLPKRPLSGSALQCHRRQISTATIPCGLQSPCC